MPALSKMLPKTRPVLLTQAIYETALSQSGLQGSGFAKPLPNDSKLFVTEKKGHLLFHIHQPSLTERYGCVFVVDTRDHTGVFGFSSMGLSNFRQLPSNALFRSAEHMFQAACISHHHDALPADRYAEVMNALFAAPKPSGAIAAKRKITQDEFLPSWDAVSQDAMRAVTIESCKDEAVLGTFREVLRLAREVFGITGTLVIKELGDNLLWGTGCFVPQFCQTLEEPNHAKGESLASTAARVSKGKDLYGLILTEFVAALEEDGLVDHDAYMRAVGDFQLYQIVE